MGRLKRGGGEDDLDEDDEDGGDVENDEVEDGGDAGDDENETDEDASEDEEESTVQRMKLEGVADVRPVGDSAGSLAPVGNAGGGKGTKGASKSDKPASSPAADSGEATQKGSSENESAEEGKIDGGESVGVDISLMDVFEEEAHVDERLRYLAESEEDVAVQELASELREFLASLER